MTRLCTLVFVSALTVLSTVAQADNPPVIQPVIIRTLPHPGQGFTQGLFYHSGNLYEGTGLVGSSQLNIIQAADGALLGSIPLPQFFGEGIAVLGDILMQLTWTGQKAFIYTFPALELTGTVTYSGEGWGLTSDSARFIMSNGSDTLFFRDSSFQIIGSIRVTSGGVPVPNLNELEYARGLIYANIWREGRIVEIAPASGMVLRIIDCSSLLAAEQPAGPDNVLNGIAWERSSDHFYLTGKRWKSIFEAEIPVIGPVKPPQDGNLKH